MAASTAWDSRSSARASATPAPSPYTNAPAVGLESSTDLYAGSSHLIDSPRAKHRSDFRTRPESDWYMPGQNQNTYSYSEVLFHQAKPGIDPVHSMDQYTFRTDHTRYHHVYTYSRECHRCVPMVRSAPLAGLRKGQPASYL